MRFLFLFLLSTALLLQGCAAAYKGPQPNFALAGAQAQAEADRFSFDESSHFLNRGFWFAMGPEKKAYTISSLTAMIETVSPEALSTIKRAQRWRWLQYATYGVALAAVMAAASNDHVSSRDQLYFASAFVGASGFAMGFVYDSLLSSAAYEYNRDLRRKFDPILTYNWAF
ncbi:MAG: hypothetical protein KF799_12230 [Bdellovibrionales bacterium]|nr:hypothetical protein [Bdellovibrionales bacterium]